ncbi:hypothetical protein [Cupriavidus sp. SIMBA_020]|uniref:hypothetical protein n=1 Tax=Cupriavidus sp. SIMBA_020 TaxID=3085766 RepID=UPI00397CC0A0
MSITDLFFEIEDSSSGGLSSQQMKKRPERVAGQTTWDGGGDKRGGLRISVKNAKSPLARALDVIRRCIE